MEISKEPIRITYGKGETLSQITLDDDFNVPDTNPDVDRILTFFGDIHMDHVRVMEGRLALKGKLVFNVLCGTEKESEPVHSIKGELPFEEMLNMDGVTDGDDIRIAGDIEDLNISLINSRKISVKAVVDLKVLAEETIEKEACYEITGEEDIQYMTRHMQITSVKMRMKDTFRVKDEFEISGNKPNIAKVLWSNAQLRTMDIRPDEDKLELRGEIFLFVLYQGEDENSSLQWVEQTIPINGSMVLVGCTPESIPDVEIHLTGNEVEPKPDYDGEQRMMGVDYVLDMDIRLYDDNESEVINDVYSSMQNLEPIEENVPMERLTLKNSSKCKAMDKIKLSKDHPRMLQIISCAGTVKVEHVEMLEDGLSIEGVVRVVILYMALDDRNPLQAMEGYLPFTHKLEAPISPNTMYKLRASLEQLGAMMLNGEEIELKAVITLDTMLFDRVEEPIVTDVTASPYDYKEIEKLPGIVGYIVKKEDTLWKIAKKFYTTVDSIRNINDLKDERIRPGDRLVIVKKVEELS